MTLEKRNAHDGCTCGRRLPISGPTNCPPHASQNPLLLRATVTDRGGGQPSTSAGTDSDGFAPPAARPVALPPPAPRRGRVPFEIGCSPADWMRLTRKEKDLAGEMRPPEEEPQPARSCQAGGPSL